MELIAALSLLVIILFAILLFTPVYRKVTTEHATPFWFDIKNHKSEKKKVVLYGANDMDSVANYGSETGIDIECVNGVTYLQHLRQSQVKPFQIKRITIKSTVRQIMEMSVITIASKDANGQQAHIPIVINSYITDEIKSEQDKEKEVYLNIDYMVKIDGGTSLSLNLIGSSKAKFIIYYKTERFTRSNYFSILIKGVDRKKKQL